MQIEIFVIGASGRSGTALCRALTAAGRPVVAVVRSAARWQQAGIEGEMRLADLADPLALQAALAGASSIVSCAHARHAPAILTAAPGDARFVFLGSTRKFTRWPDAHGRGVLAGEAAFRASGRPGVMLHPTMIYGAEGEDNVRRLAALLRRLPVVPLPGGGTALVQPIHQDDVTRCLVAALDHPWTQPESLVIAGPAPLPYADFVRAVATAARLPAPRILSASVSLLMLGARLFGRLPGLPHVHPDEIRRLLEDKAFDITQMRAVLHVQPTTVHDGLATTFDTVE